MLSAGTYSLDLIYVAWNDAGVMTWSLDDTAVGTIDGYSQGGQYNSQATLDNIVVGASGAKTLTVEVSSKADASGLERVPPGDSAPPNELSDAARGRRRVARQRPCLWTSRESSGGFHSMGGCSEAEPA